MKKSVILTAGVAAASLLAGAASAQSLQVKQQGQQTFVAAGTLPGSLLPPGVGPVDFAVELGTVDIPYAGWSLFGFQIVPPITNAQNQATANDANATNPAWHGVTYAVSNVGTASLTDGAIFTLAGEVTKDCAFYTGNKSTIDFDFGQIGVYVSDNTGPAAAFTMVAPAVMTFDTNLAGCNTPNTVKIEKGNVNGLLNTTGGAYNADVFQANLPFRITARYDAVSGPGTSTLTVTEANYGNIAGHGAWKSDMSLEVIIPQADKALLAGDYTGSFTVTIAAAI